MFSQGGQSQPDQKPGSGGQSQPGGSPFGGGGASAGGGGIFGGGGGKPAGAPLFGSLGGGGASQPGPAVSGGASQPDKAKLESQPAGQGDSQAPGSNPLGQPNPQGVDSAKEQKPPQPAPAAEGSGRDQGQIDSSSHAGNQAQPGNGRPAQNAAPSSSRAAIGRMNFDQREVEKCQLRQSQAQLNLMLKRWVSRANERALHESQSEIVSALGAVNLVYRLNKDDVSIFELQQQLASQSLEWSDWMLYNTKRENRQFGPAGGQEAPDQSDEARKKLSPLLCKELLIPLCEQFNLEPVVARRLLDSYFCERPKDYHFLYSLEQGLAKHEAELAHQQQLAQQAEQMRARAASPAMVSGHFQHGLHAQHQAAQATVSSLTQKHEKLLRTFRDQVLSTKKQLLHFYLQERACLLENLIIVFAQSSPLSRQATRSMVKMREELLGRAQLITNLIENLKRNLRWEQQEFKCLDQQSRPIVLSSIQREQILMLELLFTISLEQQLRESRVDIEVSHLAIFFEYLAMNDFSGMLLSFAGQQQVDYLRYQHCGLDSLTDAQRIAQNKIKDLGTITYLAMLRVDVFQAVGSSPEAASPEGKNLLKAWYSSQNSQPQQQHLRSLRQHLKSIRPDPSNSIACIALMQVLRRIEQLMNIDPLLQPQASFTSELFGQPFVSQLDTLLRQSPLLLMAGRSFSPQLDISAASAFSSHTSMTGEFLKVLKSFINLVYEPVLLKYGSEEDLQAVRAVTVDVLLKNGKLLRQVWKQVDQSRSSSGGKQAHGFGEEAKDVIDVSTSFSTLKMFESVLMTPMSSLQFYTYLLRVMCGKNRNKYAHYAFNMLDLQFVKMHDGPAPGQADFAELLTLEDLKRNLPHNKLLHEMLVALVLLLSEFNQIAPRATAADLIPWKTDVLMNLIVIFSKIIKQSPQNCAALGRALQEILENQEAQNGGRHSASFKAEELFRDLDLHYALQFLLVDSDTDVQSEPNPELSLLLNLLTSSLFVLMRLNIPCITCTVLKHVFDALSGFFSSIPALRKRVIDTLCFNQAKYQLNVVAWVGRNCQEYERAERDARCTVSFLKFMTKVFKTEQPQMLLNQNWQVKISHSILDEMLRSFYRFVLRDFFKFEFSSIGRFSKFAKRVLKLTYTLLAKFDSGDSSVLRIDCKQPCPRYDPLLNLIAENLAEVNLDIILQPLELEEITGFAQSFNNIRQSYLENKFHAKLISRQAMSASNGWQAERDYAAWSSGGANAAHEKILVNDMISQSLKCISQMVRLCVQAETANLQLLDKEGRPKSENFLDTRGVKLYYIQRFSFIKELRHQLIEPTGARGHIAGGDLPSSRHNIVSLMAFYSKVECEAQPPGPGDHDQNATHTLIASASQIKIETNVLAVSCLKMFCQLWCTQHSQRMDFKQLLLKNGFLLPEDVKNIFLVPLVAALRHLGRLQREPQGSLPPESRAMVRILRRYLIQMFELLTLCAHSQKPFLLLLLQQRLGASASGGQSQVRQLMTVLVHFFDSLGGDNGCLGQREEYARQMARTLSQRVVSFLSVMIQEKTGADFLRELFDLSPIARSDANAAPRNLLQRITENLIQPICVADGMTDATRLDFRLDSPVMLSCEPGTPLFDYFQQEQPNAASNNQSIFMKVHNHCSSILTLVEFLKLVQGLYALEPNHNTALRAIVASIFSGKPFANFFHAKSVEELKRDASQICEELKHLNQIFQNNSGNFYDAQFRKEQWDIIERENVLLNEQHCSQLTHALVSKPAQPGGRPCTTPIYLSEVDSHRTINALAFLQGQILGSTSPLHFSQLNALASSFMGIFCPSGGIGGNLCFDSSEIKYTLLSNGYHDLHRINALTTLAARYNLTMSCLWSQKQLVVAKDQFMMSVGRVKMAQNLRSMPGVQARANGAGVGKSGNRSLQILASMFPLVDKDFPRNERMGLTNEEIVGCANRLLGANFEMLKKVFGEMKMELQPRGGDMSAQAGRTYLDAKHSEATFEFLETVLGSLNLCVSPSALSNSCAAEQPDRPRQLVEYICKDFLVHLPKVFNESLSVLSASGGSQGSLGAREPRLDAEPSRFGSKHSSHAALFMQLVLSSFQILESITKEEQFDSSNQRTQGIQACLPQVVRLMSSRYASTGANDSADGHGGLFQTCLRALQVSIDLLSERSVQEFMDRGTRDQPLGLVIKRLIDVKTPNIRETIMIVQFLNTYAQSRHGAEHLYSENVFQHLLSSPCVAQAQAHDYYLIPGGRSGGERDPYSILWLQVLLLVRSLNDHLLDDEVHMGDSALPRQRQRTDMQSYMRSVTAFLQQRQIVYRVQRLLSSQEDGQSVLITQAQLEETELTVCIIRQLFSQAELLGKTSYGLLQGLKDCLIFGTMRLLSRFAHGINPDVRVTSPTEKFLKNQTAYSILQQHKRGGDPSRQQIHPAAAGHEMVQGFSLFDLKAQIQAVKILMTSSASLLDLLLQDKELSVDSTAASSLPQSSSPFRAAPQATRSHPLFPANWHYLHTMLISSAHHQNSLYEDFHKSYICTDLASTLRSRAEAHGHQALLQLALQLHQDALTALQCVYKQWNANVAETEVLFRALKALFENDDLITAEYHGLNSAFLSSSGRAEAGMRAADGEDFEDFMDMFETALQIGNMVSSVLLERMYECSKGQIKMSSFGSEAGVSQRAVMECASDLHAGLVSLEKDVELGGLKRPAPPFDPRSRRPDGGGPPPSDDSSKAELVMQCKALQEWSNEIYTSAQASMSSNRASLIHGLAAATPYTPEKSMLYETDRFGLGNAQGIDRGGDRPPPEASAGTAAAKPPPSNQDPQKVLNEYSGAQKRT